MRLGVSKERVSFSILAMVAVMAFFGSVSPWVISLSF